MPELDTQTRSDLQGMLAVAEEHWDRHGCCLQICLQSHIWGHERRFYHGISKDLQKRMRASFVALGFEEMSDGFAWNDNPKRTKFDVLALIRNTLDPVRKRANR